MRYLRKFADAFGNSDSVQTQMFAVILFTMVMTAANTIMLTQAGTEIAPGVGALVEAGVLGFVVMMFLAVIQLLAEVVDWVLPAVETETESGPGSREAGD
jgi:hypothetical protein